jgi:hypothetical protein
MIDRRDVLKLMVVGVTAAVVAGSGVTGQAGADATGEPMQFSIEGDMGAVRATVNGETFLVSGAFAERATFTLG